MKCQAGVFSLWNTMDAEIKRMAPSITPDMQSATYFMNTHVFSYIMIGFYYLLLEISIQIDKHFNLIKVTCTLSTS